MMKVVFLQTADVISTQEKMIQEVKCEEYKIAAGYVSTVFDGRALQNTSH